MSALVLFFSGLAIHPRNQTISEKLEPWIKVLCYSQNSVFSNLCYSQNSVFSNLCYSQNTPNERRSYALGTSSSPLIYYSYKQQETKQDLPNT